MQTPLWEQPVMRRAAGRTLRPGGFRLTDRAANLIDLVPGQRILDVGCGLGSTMNRLRSRYGVQAYGVEPNAGQLSRVESANGLLQAYGDALPFHDNTFHALFCECVLSLVPDAPQGLHEFHRVLRPGGSLIISDLFAADSDIGVEQSCAAQAVPLSRTQDMVRQAGFKSRLVEDHSHHLKELAAQLVFAAENEDSPCACTRSGLGYFLMIARKRGNNHV